MFLFQWSISGVGNYWKVLVFDGECDWKQVTRVKLRYGRFKFKPKVCFSNDDSFVLVLAQNKEAVGRGYQVCIDFRSG